MESEVNNIKDKELSNDEMDDGCSSSDSIEDEEEVKYLKQVSILNEKINNSPFDYQSHISRISLLRKCGEYEQLLAARKQMADKFPLTQELWLQWLEDDQKCAESDEEHQQVEELFEQAIRDYMCPEIWLEYSQYAIRYIGKEGGFEKIRGILKRALSAVGLHVCKGASIWEAYREIENAILVSVQPTLGSISTPAQDDLVNNQTARISSLFTRQLAIPLLDMEQTWEEYEEWRASLGENEDIPHHVQEAYKKALEKLQELSVYEAELVNKEIPNIDTYKKYIDFEKRSNDPARVQCIYERALAENCLNSELWNDYLLYVNRILKKGPIVVSCFERAVRNCPWTSTLWQNYLLSLERNDASFEKLDQVYKEALQVGFSTAGDYAYLLQTWCDINRRRYCVGDDKDELGRVLRQVFESSTSYLLKTIFPVFKSTGDPDYTLWCYWSRCEARYLKNIVKSRQILDIMMEEDADARRNWKIWREYYEIERMYGDIEHCRAVLRRAVQLSAADDGAAELACEHYVRFERENGNLEELDEALKKVEARLAKVHKRKEKVAQQIQDRKKKWEENGQNARKWKKKEERVGSKRPSSSKESRSETPKKRSKPETPMSSSSLTASEQFKTPSSLPIRFNKVSPKKNEDSQSVVKISPPPGFQDGSKQVTEKKSLDPPSDDQRTPESEKRTVFLSNLGFEVESIEEKLKQIFSSCGSIKSIRLIRSNKGHFRGYAYVEFDDQSCVELALKLDRTPLDGRPIFVSPNVDKTKNPDFKVFKYSKGMEKHKLFVSGLCFDTTEETLQSVFSPHGAIKSLRIVTARSGKSKGLAYVEYEDEANAAQAVMKLDQTLLDGFTIKVAISNPPSRDRPSDDRGKFLGGGGGGNKDVGGRGRGRTQVSFLPRSLQNSSIPKQDEKLGKRMSNQDFAKLLLKN